ncbi:hypothetical protein MRX96_024788 [Rhipicephalus microplus]
MPTFELMSWLRKLGVLELRPGDKTRMAAFNFGVPSPDDISENQRLSGQVGAPARAAGANKELLPAVDSALRQSFPKQPQPDVEDKRCKASSETLKVPSATNSNRSSPDLDRKEPSPEAGGGLAASRQRHPPKHQGVQFATWLE